MSGREVRSSTTARLGLVGARGHTGAELLALIDGHPQLELAFASSRELAGQSMDGGDQTFVAFGPDEVARADVDVVVLALPNGASAPYVRAIEQSARDVVIIDLSADHRFDDAWTYGLVERNRSALAGARRIANPGCYATGMQLALTPFLDVLDGPAHVFGVSGYSGAGTTPSRKNDVSVLHDNLLAYALTHHVHEREVTRHLAHPVHFTPHVASFFRGIHLTVAMQFLDAIEADVLLARLHAFAESEPLVKVTVEPPEVKAIGGRHHVEIGGLAVVTDERRAVVCATIDNLLKGAATQAIQNANLALGYDELTGIPLER
jgi:N-acetyl-gamma-glutamyl-phosphate reductase